MAEGSGASAREVKVVLLGDAGVGKSCLVLRFVTGSFDKFSESTIGAWAGAPVAVAAALCARRCPRGPPPRTFFFPLTL